MLNRSIWPIDRTLSSATTPGQSGLGSNGKERVFHISQSSRTGASSYRSFSVISRTFIRRGGLFLGRDSVNVFYSPIPHFPKLQGWSLAIRWFNVIPRTLIEWMGVLTPLCRDAISIFYNTTPPNWADSKMVLSISIKQ